METVAPPVQENTPPVRPVQTTTPQDASQRAAIIERLNGVTALAGPSIGKLYSIYYLDSIIHLFHLHSGAVVQIQYYW